MKLLCISDIHGNQWAVDSLVAHINKPKDYFDAVVVAGDVLTKNIYKRNGYAEFVSIMSKLAEFGDKVFYCLGNWDEDVPYSVPELGDNYVHVHQGVTEFKG